MKAVADSAEAATGAVPEYLPARMLNEFVYCPRLFFYEWVQGEFRESADTLEGKFQHRRVDEKATPLPAAEDLDGDLRSRSVTLSSERYGVIARMDLVEASGGIVTPVDYKHGEPRETDKGIELWPADKVQLAVQGLILRDNGYACQEGLVYYFKTKQRVRVQFDEELVAQTIRAMGEARAVAAAGRIPPPLEDSPKCPGCSLVGICLPDETRDLSRRRQAADAVQLPLFEDRPCEVGKGGEVRRLVAPRDELRPVYLSTQGMRVGKSGEVLQVREKDALKQEIRIGEICQLNVMGNIQVSTQAIQTLCEAHVPICYFSQGGWFYGITGNLNVKNVFLRQSQFRLAEQEWFALLLAKRLVAGKTEISERCCREITLSRRHRPCMR